MNKEQGKTNLNIIYPPAIRWIIRSLQNIYNFFNIQARQLKYYKTAWNNMFFLFKAVRSSKNHCYNLKQNENWKTNITPQSFLWIFCAQLLNTFLRAQTRSRTTATSKISCGSYTHRPSFSILQRIFPIDTTHSQFLTWLAYSPYISWESLFN